MALSRTRNMQDLKVPMRRFQTHAPVKRGKTEESEAPEGKTHVDMPEKRDPGTPSRGAFKAADRTSDRNPPRSGRPSPSPRKDPADSEGRKPPELQGRRVRR